MIKYNSSNTPPFVFSEDCCQIVSVRNARILCNHQVTLIVTDSIFFVSSTAQSELSERVSILPDKSGECKVQFGGWEPSFTILPSLLSPQISSVRLPPPTEDKAHYISRGKIKSG